MKNFQRVAGVSFPRNGRVNQADDAAISSTAGFGPQIQPT